MDTPIVISDRFPTFAIARAAMVNALKRVTSVDVTVDGVHHMVDPDCLIDALDSCGEVEQGKFHAVVARIDEALDGDPERVAKELCSYAEHLVSCMVRVAAA